MLSSCSPSDTPRGLPDLHLHGKVDNHCVVEAQVRLVADVGGRYTGKGHPTRWWAYALTPHPFTEAATKKMLLGSVKLLEDAGDKCPVCGRKPAEIVVGRSP